MPRLFRIPFEFSKDVFVLRTGAESAVERSYSGPSITVRADGRAPGSPAAPELAADYAGLSADKLQHVIARAAKQTPAERYAALTELEVQHKLSPSQHEELRQNLLGSPEQLRERRLAALRAADVSTLSANQKRSLTNYYANEIAKIPSDHQRANAVLGGLGTPGGIGRRAALPPEIRTRIVPNVLSIVEHMTHPEAKAKALTAVAPELVYYGIAQNRRFMRQLYTLPGLAVQGKVLKAYYPGKVTWGMRLRMEGTNIGAHGLDASLGFGGDEGRTELRIAKEEREDPTPVI